MGGFPPNDVIPSLTTLPMSSQIERNTSPGASQVFEKRHFALAAKVLRFDQGLVLSQSRGGRKVSPSRDSARKPPSRPALSAPPENGKTAPLRRGDSAVFPDTPQFACQ